MIGVKFHNGALIEYPQADYIHTDAAPAIQFVRKPQSEHEEWVVIAELDAKDIKEIYDDTGHAKPITA